MPSTRRQTLIISRDQDNTLLRQRFGSFLQPDPPRLGQECRITDPESSVLHLGYRQLLDCFFTSPTVDAVQGAIADELNS